MNWKTVRLELAVTEGYPQGSASRVYQLRVPLDGHGLIDGDALDRDPFRATVRRFWACEPDQHGQVERANDAWIFRCCRAQLPEEIRRFESQPLLPGAEVIIEEPNGTTLPFKVAAVRGFSSQSPPAG